jgi:tetratricopeptide (TPR) repeat protein
MATAIALPAFTALQCVPMPVGWLSIIAPHNADVWSRALAPLREACPSWVPISLDPVATRIEVLKGVAYALAFVTALGIARRRDGARFLSAIVVVTALVLAFAAVAHPAFGVRRLFGVYEPGPGIAARHVAPLMNPNNLAGYLNVGLCLSLAALLAPEPHVPRSLAAGAVVLLCASQVWVASRGGVMTMVLGALIVIVIARVTRAKQTRKGRSAALITGSALVLAAAFFVLSGSDEATNELLDADVSKYKMFADSLRSVPAMPFFGCGRGAFESVFPSFRAATGYLTYSHPENFVAQWVVEWGLPVGLGGLAALAFALRPNVMLARSATAGGAWAAIVTVAVQNLADLGSEIPGLVLAIVVCAAIVAAGTPGHKSTLRIERWARHPRGVACACAMGAAAAIALGLASLGKELHHDEQALYQAALDPRTSREQMRAMARAAMLRHPAEPYLPFVASLRATRERDDDPIPWLGATLERARVYGPAHMVLAQVLTSRSPSQARFEYRLAMEQAPNLVGSVMAEAPRVVGGYFDAMELVPQGKEGVLVSDLLARGIQDRLPATRVRIDRALAATSPTAPGPLSRLAEDAVQDLDALVVAPWCQGPPLAACVTDALSKSKRLTQLEPSQCQGYALHARARAAGGDAAGAVAELEEATDNVTDRVGCLQQLVSVARKAGKAERVEAAFDKIAILGCGDDAACADTLRWVGQQYESMGKPHRALSAYRRAFGRVPDEALLSHMAELAMAAGLHAEAAADYEQLAKAHPQDERWRRLAVGEHDAAMREAQRL